MKKRVFIIILVLFLFNINLIYAEEINFIYPQNIIIGREFNASLILLNFSQDIYDVKFEILNGTNNIAERFWNNAWKSVFYWITDAINLSQKNNETFRLNITENYYGLNNISVKIRNSLNKEFKFFYLLNISNFNYSNSPQNISNQNNNSQNSSDIYQNKGIYYNLSWNEEDIITNKEFKIKTEVFNLEDGEYDVKLWIETDKIISERYDEKNNEWKSGIYYINNFFVGPGNKSEKIKIRIEENINFTGEANLFFRIRDESEISYKIKILERSKEKSIENAETNSTINSDVKNERTNNEVVITSNVIKLGKIINNKTEKTDNINTNYVVYESKIEMIKKYSVYGFAFLCVVLCVLIIWRKI